MALSGLSRRGFCGMSATVAYGWSSCQTTFFVMRSPSTRSPRPTGRSTWPSVNSAVAVRASSFSLMSCPHGTARLYSK
jgi:hypothetical protein